MNKLLIKIPTRERGFIWLQSYLDNITNPNTIILLTLDNDETEEPPAHPQIIYVRGNSKSKIDAINRDIDLYIDQFDILLIGSDDMIPQIKGFDQIILDDMNKHYPDGDGCLWYNTEDAEPVLKDRYSKVIKAGSDEFYTKWICMMPIMGTPYYQRFGYVYHPSYRSFSCDDEQTIIAHRLKKITYIHQRIVKHKHPAWDKEGEGDNLYTKNDRNWNYDRTNLRRRQARGFPANE